MHYEERPNGGNCCQNQLCTTDPRQACDPSRRIQQYAVNYGRADDVAPIDESVDIQLIEELALNQKPERSNCRYGQHQERQMGSEFRRHLRFPVRQLPLNSHHPAPFEIRSWTQGSVDQTALFGAVTA
jgi:hypothetical protein